MEKLPETDNIIEKSVKYEGQWLDFKTISLKTSSKTIKNYEFIERSSKKKHNPNQDGVTIIPIVFYPSTSSRKLMILANFRPPVNAFVLEFPGGLVETDSGIEDALRELKEETGYVGKRILEENFRCPLNYFDPWKSTENSKLIFVEVDGEDERNRDPKQNLDDEEEIRVILVEFDRDLVKNLERIREENNYKMSSELYSFALGTAMSSVFKNFN